MYKIYAAMENADLTEGRGPMIARGYFANKEDATKFATEICMGVMGVGHGEVKEIEVLEDLSEHPKWTREMIIQGAKRKLSDAELFALGLSR